MKFCPLTQKECRNDCQLYASVNGKCAIYIIADRQYTIANTTVNIANSVSDISTSQQKIATEIRQINQNKK